MWPAGAATCPGGVGKPAWPEIALSDITQAPEWFRRALEHEASAHEVEVDGCRIHYRLWGESAAPPLLLIHGGGAHTHWWDFIAPLLARDYRVGAFDLSGMGDSGRRDHYEFEIYARETVAVCEAAGFDERAVLVGHSLGGAVALLAVHHHPERFGALITADSPVRPPGFRFPGGGRNPLSRERKRYPDRETILGRFRVMPEQPCANGYILDHIARHSIVELDDGWSWKFDDRIAESLTMGHLTEPFSQVRIPKAVIYGGLSALFPAEVLTHMRNLAAHRAAFVEIPDAHHHLFLDQPIAFVSAVRAVLEGWRLAPGTRLFG